MADRELCAALRHRLPLEVVSEEDVSGFPIPAQPHGVVLFRGQGDLDYACGRCGGLLAIGVLPGMLRRFVFACVCGALNVVPRSAASSPK